MKAQNNDQISLEVDDEHPFFNAVWERSKASRAPQPPGTDVPPALTAELRIGDTVQQFALESVADLSWLDARAVMRTSWRRTGGPVTITTQPTGDQKA